MKLRKDVQIDHVIPCGRLAGAEDIAGFLERLTPENGAAFQVVCRDCHKAKTAAERAGRKAKKNPGAD